MGAVVRLLYFFYSYKNFIWRTGNHIANICRISGSFTKLMSATYKQSNILSSLFSSIQKQIIVENENGTFDIIPINSSYKNIKIDGPQGKTEIEINNGLVKVTKSTCRHKLCEKSQYASNVGDVIACAPNKVLIRIEEV